MNGFEMRERKCNRKFKRKLAPDRHNAPVAVTTSVMFNFALLRRKIIIDANPHLKNTLLYFKSLPNVEELLTVFLFL